MNLTLRRPFQDKHSLMMLALILALFALAYVLLHQTDVAAGSPAVAASKGKSGISIDPTIVGE